MNLRNICICNTIFRDIFRPDRQLKIQLVLTVGCISSIASFFFSFFCIARVLFRRKFFLIKGLKWHFQKALSEMFIVCWKCSFNRIWHEQLEVFIGSNSYSNKYLVLLALATPTPKQILHRNTYPKKLFVAYLKFKLNWTYYILSDSFVSFATSN